MMTVKEPKRTEKIVLESDDGGSTDQLSIKDDQFHLRKKKCIRMAVYLYGVLGSNWLCIFIMDANNV